MKTTAAAAFNTSPKATASWGHISFWLFSKASLLGQTISFAVLEIVAIKAQQ